LARVSALRLPSAYEGQNQTTQMAVKHMTLAVNRQRPIVENLQEGRHVHGIHAPEHHVVPCRPRRLELKRQSFEHGGILRAEIARMQRLITIVGGRLPGM